MLEKKPELKMACEPLKERKDDFLEHISKELETFNLEEQNYILKELYNILKEKREFELKDLNVKVDLLSKAISSLG